MVAKPRIRERSALLIFLLVGLMTVAYSSIGIYTPAMPAIAQYFGVTATEVQLTFSIYIVSFALGQLVYGPISDRYGRRLAIFIGLAIYVVGSGMAALSFSIEMLIVSRAVQAFGGCCGPVIGRAILRDLFNRDKGARILSYVTMVMGAAPAFAPVIGGYLQVAFNWQAIFFFLLIIGLLVLILNVLFMEETNLLPTKKTSFGFFHTLNSYIFFIRSPLFIGYTLTAAFAMSAVFVYSAGAPFLLIELLYVPPDRYGWYVLIPTSANLFGAFFAAQLVSKLGGDRMIFIGAFLILLGGSLMMLWAVFGSLSIAAVIAPMCIVMFGIATLYPSAAQAAVSLFPTQAGTASSLNGFLHMVVAAAMVILLGSLADGGKWPMINLVLTCSALTFLSLIIIGVCNWRKFKSGDSH